MRHHRRFDWAKFLFIGGLIVLIIAAIGIYAKRKKLLPIGLI